MPYCANCDEWFRGKKDPSVCEHCDQINPSHIIENQDDDPAEWVCRRSFEVKSDLFNFRLAMVVLMCLSLASTVYFGFSLLGIAIPMVFVPLGIFALTVQRGLRVTVKKDLATFEWVLSSFGRVLRARRTKRSNIGPVIVRTVDFHDRATGEWYEKYLVILGGQFVTGFEHRDSAWRLAEILGKHCGLTVESEYRGE